MFTVYPAIDIKDGKCVRLLKGKMDKDTIYNQSPSDQAKKFAKAGFEWIHLVDLNGAIEGKSVNFKAIEEIIKTTNCRLQLGGGIRSYDSAKKWLDNGIERIIIGTAALDNPSLVNNLAKDYPKRIAVGIDAIDGYVATKGWVEKSTTKAIDLAKKYEQAGVCAIIFTDISKDGTLEGVNIEQTNEIAEAVKIPVIASGGVASKKDLQLLSNIKSISGVIVGRAIYEEKISLQEAIESSE